MTTLFRRLRRPVAGRAAAAALTLGLVGVALLFSSPASAQTRPCSDDVMSAPTGPATVSAASTTSYGRVLVVGSGDYGGWLAVPAHLRPPPCAVWRGLRV